MVRVLERLRHLCLVAGLVAEGRVVAEGQVAAGVQEVAEGQEVAEVQVDQVEAPHPNGHNNYLLFVLYNE